VRQKTGTAVLNYAAAKTTAPSIPSPVLALNVQTVAPLSRCTASALDANRRIRHHPPVIPTPVQRVSRICAETDFRQQKPSRIGNTENGAIVRIFQLTSRMNAQDLGGPRGVDGHPRALTAKQQERI
jgi:hypothetical protein